MDIIMQCVNCMKKPKKTEIKKKQPPGDRVSNPQMAVKKWAGIGAILANFGLGRARLDTKQKHDRV